MSKIEQWRMGLKVGDKVAVITRDRPDWTEIGIVSDVTCGRIRIEGQDLAFDQRTGRRDTFGSRFIVYLAPVTEEVSG